MEQVNEVNRIKKARTGRKRFGISLSCIFLNIEILSCFVFSLALGQPVQAKFFYIPSGDVAGLINAINTANSNGRSNVIFLVAGNYSLTTVDNNTDGANGLPSITSNITIIGSSANRNIIERVANAPDFRIFHVAATGALRLIGLTVKGGSIDCCNIGGGIFNDGTLTITNGIITGNSAEFEGGGIAGDGPVTILNSTISLNSAQDGGGIFSNGPVNITGSVIANNSAGGFGGGIWGGVPLTIINSTISGNSAQFFGGGIASGEIIITNSTIFNNSSGLIGGGIGVFEGLNPSTSTITKSTISNNTGGSFGDAISNPGGSTLNIIDSAISDNADSGSIDNEGGVINIINTTISNNVVGIENDLNGTVNIINSTIADNALGIVNSDDEFNGDGKVLLENTLLANNAENGSSSDCSGSITSLGNNIIGDANGCTLTLQQGDLTGDPGLDTYKDNGTPGNGHFPLLPGSQAIDAGNNNVCLANPILATDQIGEPRNGCVFSSFGHKWFVCRNAKSGGQEICDIGSIEFQKRR